MQADFILWGERQIVDPVLHANFQECLSAATALPPECTVFILKEFQICSLNMKIGASSGVSTTACTETRDADISIVFRAP